MVVLMCIVGTLDTLEVLVSADERGVHLDAEARAQVVVPKAASITWSMAADRRLDQLVELANEVGANTRRNELAAALVAAAQPDGQALLDLVVSWRRARVRDVVVDVPSSADVIQLPRYGPGRRRSAG
jgi:hypothetical protein